MALLCALGGEPGNTEEMRMVLYRATYQHADGHIRGMTFAACDAVRAAAYAEAWACGDKLLTVAAVRPLQLPPVQLVLAP